MHLINNGECRQLPRFYSEKKGKQQRTAEQKNAKGITLESRRQGLTNGTHINILFIVVTLLLHLSKGDA